MPAREVRLGRRADLVEHVAEDARCRVGRASRVRVDEDARSVVRHRDPPAELVAELELNVALVQRREHLTDLLLACDDRRYAPVLSHAVILPIAGPNVRGYNAARSTRWWRNW